MRLQKSSLQALGGNSLSVVDLSVARSAPVELVVVVHDGVSVRHERCSLCIDESLVIGRAWHCDIVLQDPQVDVEHAELKLGDDGELYCADLGSLNGSRILVASNAEKLQRRRGSAITQESGALKVDSGTTLKLGRSRIDIFRRDHAVSPAVKPSRWDGIRRSLEKPLWSSALLIVLLVSAVATRLTESVQPLSVDMMVSGVSLLAVVCGVWVFFWGLLSKLWRDAMHLRAHLSIVAAAGAFAYLIAQLGRYVGWQLQSVDAVTFILTVGEALVIFFALTLTLGVATRLRPRSILWLASIPGLLLVVSVYLLPHLSDDEVEWYPELITSSYPPGWQIAPSESLDEFLGSSSQLFERRAEQASKRAAELAEKLAGDGV